MIVPFRKEYKIYHFGMDVALNNVKTTLTSWWKYSSFSSLIEVFIMDRCCVNFGLGLAIREVFIIFFSQCFPLFLDTCRPGEWLSTTMFIFFHIMRDFKLVSELFIKQYSSELGFIMYFPSTTNQVINLTFVGRHARHNK